MTKVVLLVLLSAIPYLSFSQIWKETFDELPNGTTEDNGPTAWFTEAPTSQTFSRQAYAIYKIFAINDTGGEEGLWKSEIIDISSSPEVAIEITLGSYWASNTDYIRCFYKIDGGPEVMFGEQFGATDLNIASLASAIVSGNSLEIIIEASENTPGTFNGFPRIMGIDDITVSSILYLYSINSGNWDSTNSWSQTGYDGSSCLCTPDKNTHVFIGDDHNVALVGTAESAGLTVQNSGNLNYAAYGKLNIIRGGNLKVESGGGIRKNGNIGTTLNFSTHSYNVNIDGDLVVDNLIVNAANITFSGSGDIGVVNNFSVNNVVGKNLINNSTGNLSIGNSLIFSSTSSNLSFVNNGNLDISNSLRFDNKLVALENHGNFTIENNLVVVSSADNENTLNNFGIFNAHNINLNSGDFSIYNEGTINQTGDFINIDIGSVFENREGSRWNFSGGGSNNRLFVNYPDNIFIYGKEGNQSIFVPADGGYYDLHLKGSGIKSISGELNVRNDLEISGTSQLDVSSGMYQIKIGGNWDVKSTNSNPFIERSGLVVFNGTNNQHLQSEASVEKFSQLEIDKSSGDVILSGSVNTDLLISDQLILKAGGLDLNGNKLTISNSDRTAMIRMNGFIKSEKETFPYSPVIWTVGESTGEYIFPFGKAAASENYIPFVFDIKTPGVSAGTISVATYGTGRDNLPYPDNVEWLGNEMTDMVADRFWQIDLSGYSTNPVGDVTFTATEEEAAMLSTIRAQRWNSVESKWDDPISGQLNLLDNAVTVPLVNKFSPWTLVDENSILPIDLAYFKAEVFEKNVVLEWKTARETKNDYFTIERSNDLVDFEELIKVKGQGTSLQENIYKATDEFPGTGRAYYRLKQTDFDGSYKYSKIVSVEFTDKFNKIVVYPNPFNGRELHVNEEDFPDLRNQKIHVFDMKGIDVFSGAELISKDKGMTVIKLKDYLPKGIYWIKIGNIYADKFIVE